MGNTTRRAADRISSPAWELEYACLSVQGQRKAQEDRFDVRCERVTLPSEPTAAAEPTPPLDVALFGVFDGHIGMSASEFVKKRLFKVVFQELAKDAVRPAVRAAFAKIDHDFMSGVQGDSVLMQAGTTVIMALFMGGTLHVANLGDSRCVMGKTDGSHLPLSVDHKPSHPKEKERLEKHGFQVINDRINGNLAVSRAIGDLPYKNVETLASSGASSKPTIKTLPIPDDMHFLILASDGLWGFVPDEQAVRFVSRRIREGKALDTICQELVQFALDSKSDDNITIMIVLKSS